MPYSWMHKMQVEVSYANGCLDEFLLRELASYDIQCPEIIPFVATNDKNYELDGAYSSMHWSRQYEYTWGLLHADIKKTDLILDAGGGHAVLKYALAKRCEKLITIDICQESLDKSIKSSERMGFKNIDFVNCSIENYNPDIKFDKIYCISVLEHIKNKETRHKCLDNLIRLLKPNGQLFFSFDFVIQHGEEIFDFYIDRKGAAELLHYFGVDNYESNDLVYGIFDKGCIIGAVCVKATL